jgi:glycine/D-amino acid oxidase-like deaminating enzyme/nitrite reductase/ring-hydroxylating ferredoxin subunit
MSDPNETSWSPALNDAHFPKLDTDLSCDVVIVGVGITGINAAYLLQQAGKSVVVLEQGQVSTGTTRDSTGFLNNEQDIYYKDFQKKHNTEDIRMFWQKGAEAINFIEQTIQNEAIDCGFTRVPLYLYSKNVEDAQELSDEYEALQDSGFPVEFNDCRRCLGFETFGHLIYADQAKFDPVQYVVQLSQKLDRSRCRIFENTLVETVENNEGKCITKTKDGITVTSDFAIIATHTPITSSISISSLKLIPYLSYVIEARIPKGAIAEALYIDNDVPYHYLRIDTLEGEEQDRLIFGGEDNEVSEESDANEKFSALEDELRRLFPDLQYELTKKWSGMFFDPVDGLPLIGKTEGNIIVCTGYSGNGLVNGTVAAMMSCEIISGQKPPLEELLNPDRMMVSKQSIKQGLFSAKQLVQKYLPGKNSKNPNDVLPDTGEIVSLNGKKVAVYKDHNGTVTKLSPACTHLGCEVGWDDKTKLWTCPCHGSRFSPKGEVKNGPAVKPLETLE